MLSRDIMSSQTRPSISALSVTDIALYRANMEDLLSSTSQNLIIDGVIKDTVGYTRFLDIREGR